MTKSLALTLAIAILFLVGTVMDEGGPVDKLNGASSSNTLASAEIESDEAANSDVVLAEARTPAPPPAPPAKDDMWDWFGETEPAAPAAPEPRQQHAFEGSTADVGALDRERMNLEE